MAVSTFLLLSTLIAVAEYAESRPIVTAEATGSGLADGPAGGAGEAAMAAAFVTKSKRCIIYYRNITKLEAKMEELKQALELLMEMMVSCMQNLYNMGPKAGTACRQLQPDLRSVS